MLLAGPDRVLVAVHRARLGLPPRLCGQRADAIGVGRAIRSEGTDVVANPCGGDLVATESRRGVGAAPEPELGASPDRSGGDGRTDRDAGVPSLRRRARHQPLRGDSTHRAPLLAETHARASAVSAHRVRDRVGAAQSGRGGSFSRSVGDRLHDPCRRSSADRDAAGLRGLHTGPAHGAAP